MSIDNSRLTKRMIDMGIDHFIARLDDTDNRLWRDVIDTNFTAYAQTDNTTFIPVDAYTSGMRGMYGGDLITRDAASNRWAVCTGPLLPASGTPWTIGIVFIGDFHDIDPSNRSYVVDLGNDTLNTGHVAGQDPYVGILIGDTPGSLPGVRMTQGFNGHTTGVTGRPAAFESPDATFNPELLDGKPHTAIFVNDGAGNISAYGDGEFNETETWFWTTPSDPIEVNHPNPTIGTNYESKSNGTFGGVFSHMSRALTANEISELHGLLTTYAGAIQGIPDTEYMIQKIDAIKVTTDKIDDTLEDNSGTYRFTSASLIQSPTGSGGFTTDDRNKLINVDSVATKLDDTLEDDGGEFRFTQNALEEGPGTSIPTNITDMADQWGDMVEDDGPVKRFTANTVEQTPIGFTSGDRTKLDAIDVIADKIDDTLEDDGGEFRFTTNALEQAPVSTDSFTAADRTKLTTVETISQKIDDTLEDDLGTFRFTDNALEQAPTGVGGFTTGDGDKLDYIYDRVIQTGDITVVTVFNVGRGEINLVYKDTYVDTQYDRGPIIIPVPTSFISLTGGDNVQVSFSSGVRTYTTIFTKSCSIISPGVTGQSVSFTITPAEAALFAEPPSSQTGTGQLAGWFDIQLTRNTNHKTTLFTGDFRMLRALTD